MLILVGLVVGIPLLGFALVVGSIILGFQQSGVAPDFTGYKTDMPLAGSTVVEAKVYKGGSGPKSQGPSYEQRYDSGVTMVQFKGSEPPESLICRTFSGTGTFTNNCEKGVAKWGEYMVDKTYQDGRISSITVTAQIDGTKTHIPVPASALEQLEGYTEWREYFDSMEPVDLK